MCNFISFALSHFILFCPFLSHLSWVWVYIYIGGIQAANPESEWLIPIKIYDDGKFTYIYLNKNEFSGNFPTVYGRKSERDTEFVLNSNVENDLIVVHGIYPILVLRHGNHVVGLRRN